MEFLANQDGTTGGGIHPSKSGLAYSEYESWIRLTLLLA